MPCKLCLFSQLRLGDAPLSRKRAIRQLQYVVPRNRLHISTTKLTME